MFVVLKFSKFSYITIFRRAKTMKRFTLVSILVVLPFHACKHSFVLCHDFFFFFFIFVYIFLFIGTPSDYTPGHPGIWFFRSCHIIFHSLRSSCSAQFLFLFSSRFAEWTRTETEIKPSYFLVALFCRRSAWGECEGYVCWCILDIVPDKWQKTMWDIWFWWCRRNNSARPAILLRRNG